MSSKLAFITGITGQDGSYLAELLLEKGYSVHGIYRRSSTNNNLWRIEHLFQNKNLVLHHGDLLDSTSIQNALSKIWSVANETSTLEIYNLAAQSHVQRSFEMPEYTIQADGAAILPMLEWIRNRPDNERARIRFYQASTSELFGKVMEVPQRETTPFYPRSPYGVAKLYAFWIVKNYREAYGIYATNGILFNHESPRRGDDFVTKKIVKNVVRIVKEGLENCVPMEIGNLDAQRDWGHAKDYVEGMWRILQHDVADDWVLSSNETHSVREFIERAFAHVGVKIVWRNTGSYEEGVCAETGALLVKINPIFFRPAEVDLLLGDSTRARSELKWQPSYTFEALVDDMMKSELKATR
jgi:GDPmannose 4,6-dehydratase